mgnify:CR=1 FL=1
MPTGAFAVNPINGDKLPVWVGDYVIGSYGTGAVMAVPAHDQRDFEFAKKYGLPVKAVINPAGSELDPLMMEAAFVDSGVMVNSGKFDGLPSDGAKDAIIDSLEEQGKAAVSHP